MFESRRSQIDREVQKTVLANHLKECGERYIENKRALEKLGDDYTGGLNRLESSVRESIATVNGSIAGRQTQIDDIKSFLRKILVGVIGGLLVALGTVLYNALHAKGII